MHPAPASLLIVALALAGCAPSPLYVSDRHVVGTGGDVPRDVRGEPMWSAIKPAPPTTVAPDLPTNPGVPVTPPGA